MKIGIDIGNVIIGGQGVDTFFSDHYLETPEVDGAWQAVHTLEKAGHEIHIISKCGPITEEKSMAWLNRATRTIVRTTNETILTIDRTKDAIPSPLCLIGPTDDSIGVKVFWFAKCSSLSRCSFMTFHLINVMIVKVSNLIYSRRIYPE